MHHKICITPGLVVILSPEHNSKNPSILVPMLKTKLGF
ncbi:MAG: hypothetical protein F6J98_25600 [Moorea sp. SIO4G2]|nr:hypothetical protein [Moorena sp. SIO4G2]